MYTSFTNKFFFSFLVLLLISMQLQAQFITTWETQFDNESISFIAGDGTFNYDVNWGDGTTETGFTGTSTHVYATSGTYSVSITGQFPHILISRGSSAFKSVDQWGNNQWESFVNTFWGATNLEIKATDTPDLSMVTDLSYMFQECWQLKSDFSNWNVSGITNMEGMFQGTSRASSSDWQDIENWEVGNVTNMKNTFTGNTTFNADLGNWNVSQVTTMERMFLGASAFRGVGIDNWDVSNVTNMRTMFNGAVPFSATFSNWDVGNVTNMEGMFQFSNTNSFIFDNWDVSKVTTMKQMFQGASLQTSDVLNFNNWNVSQVTTMEEMFADTRSFDADLIKLENWNVSNTTTMARMFRSTRDADLDLSAWNVSQVTDMSDMLFESGMSTENYDKLLIAWAALTVQENVPLGATGIPYCASTTEHDILTTTYSWSITDGGRMYDSVSVSESACEQYLAPDNSIHTESKIFDVTIPNQAGCDSIITIDLTILDNDSVEINETACEQYIAPDNSIHTESKTFDVVLTNTAGCDSVITINLTIIDVTVQLSGETISVVNTLAGATYQWLDCNDNNAIIAGATTSSFMANENGNYAVEITTNSCVDTSTCVEIVTVALEDDPIFQQIRLYPNPTKEKVVIDFGNLIDASIKLYRADGSLIQSLASHNNGLQDLQLGKQQGLYFIEIIVQGKRKVYKVLKE